VARLRSRRALAVAAFGLATLLIACTGNWSESEAEPEAEATPAAESDAPPTAESDAPPTASSDAPSTAESDGPQLDVTATSTVDDFGLPGDASVVAFPSLAEPPEPPAGISTCGDLHAWMRTQGAIDVGGSQVQVNLWAPTDDVTVTATKVEVVRLDRRDPFESRAIACSATQKVPDEGQLPLVDVPGDTPSRAGDARTLDGLETGVPTEVPAHYVHMFWTSPQPIELRAGDRKPYITVRLEARDGWYDWELVVHLLVDGEQRTYRLRDGRDDRPFSTNSGYLGDDLTRLPRTESYVWCVHDQPPRLHRQTAPFLCPDEDR